MDELHTTSDVINELGGLKAVAKLTGTNNKAAWNWRSFDSFPSNTYLVMIEALRERGKTAPASLWSMRAPAEASQ